ncbi:hypothetical protein [uncultured Bacteroides sp.]|uniref:hypothetical protein n=1 Tax=uncultured Bacteroides sp. TaxID=162156 RepID=UPI002AA8C8A0|nr:hypothetical protein [uncultured Bacteroides sp.]
MFFISLILSPEAFAINECQDLNSNADTIPLYSGGKIRKSIYSQTERKHSKFYNYLWGKHYRDLYSMPITIQAARLHSIYGGLMFAGQFPRLHAMFFENKSGHQYLLMPVGGSTTFMESDFFQKTYSKQEYKNTYLDKFIEDAYTITHPYAFLVANELADNIDVSSFNPKIYYIPKKAATDTIVDGTSIEDRLVVIYDLKNFTIRSKFIETEELLSKIQEDKSFVVDQDKYIRERLLDILIGDWNETAENCKWYGESRNDSLVYTPWVIDRSHAFTKVDGLLFRGILGMFGLSNITNYESQYKHLKKANAFSLPLDMALTAESGRDVWIKQAREIKHLLTDRVIDNAFTLLPKEIYGLKETEKIKKELKKRRNTIDRVAQKYYNLLQETPVITGTNKNDLFVIDQKDKRSTKVRIYDKESDRLVFDKSYDKDTKEIWLYGLGGNDGFEVDNKSKNHTHIILVGGKGTNTYQIKKGKRIRVYDYESHEGTNDSLAGAKIIKTDVEKVHAYDYQKLKYQTLKFTPWGVYDTDLGLYLGAYVSNTMYGFKRSPYTYQYRLGYSYLDGFMYQGFFPTYNEKKSFNIEAFIGRPYNFFNFFGYGNQTASNKDKDKNYNRVNIAKYTVQPSFYWELDSTQKFIVQSKLELFDIKQPTNRFINTIYDSNKDIFKTKTFVGFNLAYEINCKPGAIIPSLKFSLMPGWIFNVSELGRNIPYLKSKLSFDLAYNDRISLATELKGTVLFSDKYEFYQAATTELRGFRNNRFIGKQSFYGHTDLRLDLGHLKNPFTPLQYGVFAGFDYGRVWYPDEQSRKWHTSYGGGWWLTLFKGYTGKFSYFLSKDGGRFSFGLGIGF